MKIDPPRWIAADFECVNIPVESTTEKCPTDQFPLTNKLFVRKPVAIG